MNDAVLPVVSDEAPRPDSGWSWRPHAGTITHFLVGPTMLLSGLNSPYETMPGWAQTVMAFSPLRYYIDIACGHLLEGGLDDVLQKSVMTMVLLGRVVRLRDVAIPATV